MSKIHYPTEDGSLPVILVLGLLVGAVLIAPIELAGKGCRFLGKWLGRKERPETGEWDIKFKGE